MSAAAPVPSQNKVPHLAEGCPIPGSAKMQFSWVVGAGGGARSATGGGANTSPPCHCERVRSTLKTLAYDCGNPVQYVCGHSPAVLFYLLDRHASLAMTKGTKCPSTHHSCHSRAQGPRKYECICGDPGRGNDKLRD